MMSSIVEKDLYRIWDRHKSKGGPQAYSNLNGGF